MVVVVAGSARILAQTQHVGFAMHRCVMRWSSPPPVCLVVNKKVEVLPGGDLYSDICQTTLLTVALARMWLRILCVQTLQRLP
jgi:hypothetical protein